MTWVKIDDTAVLHPKLLDAGPEAVALWLAGLCYCNRAHTDGAIPARHLVTLFPGAWSANDVARLAARLVAVKLWEPAADGFRVHGYEDHQHEATKEVVEIRRAYERERKASQRAAARSRREGVPDNVPDKSRDMSRGTTQGHASGTTQGTPPDPVPAPRPDPTRPDPTEGEGDCPKSPRGDSDGATEEQGKAAKGAPAKAPAKAPRKPKGAPAEQRALGLPGEPPPPVAKPRRAFAPVDACNAIARASGGRFATVTEKNISAGHAIAIGAQIDRFPTIAEWQTVGAWLAAGGERTRQTLGPRWAASSDLQEAMAKAASWVEQGRPALLDARGFPVVTVAAEPADDPWARAMRKAEERGLA